MESTTAAPPSPYAHLIERHKKLRAILKSAKVDAALITSQPDLLYLCGPLGKTAAGAICSTNTLTLFGTADVPWAKTFTLKKQLAAEMADAIKVDRYKTITFDPKQTTYYEITAINQFIPSMSFQPINALVGQLRIVKDDREQAEIKKSVHGIESALIPVLDNFECKPDLTEYIVAAQLLDDLNKHGYYGSDVQVVSGRSGNGVVSAGYKVHPNKPLMIKVAAKQTTYWAKQARTYHVYNADAEAKAVHLAVTAAHEAGIKMLRAGVSTKQVYDVVAAEIRREGAWMVPLDSGSAIGIQVSEPPFISGKDCDDLLLRPNTVLYFGVRVVTPRFHIEIGDTVIVTFAGNEVWTTLPYKFEDVRLEV